jgi:hypothetical protein
MMENHPAVRPPVAQGAAAQSRDIGAVEEDPALRRVDQPIGHAQKRGLAGAGAADDPEENAARDRHVGAVRPSPAAHSTQRDRSMPRSPLTAATASPASFRIRSSRSSTPAAARTTARSSGRRSAMRSRPLAPAPRRSTIPLNFRTRGQRPYCVRDFERDLVRLGCLCVAPRRTAGGHMAGQRRDRGSRQRVCH